jgi:UDP-N-acetylglucosamine--N-acetylmuramyl-(pentapeptide) pyrophosphoryl-undecaprenol N-acetylglucosamine transferase
MLRVMIAGGGTGGHVIPALAIGRELRNRHGAAVRFVGTSRGLETRLVPEAGFELELVKVGQLKSVSLMTRMKTLAELPLGVMRCVGLLRQFKPRVVVGVGGYASGPAMMAAILLRIPTLAFEPNAVPGLANRIVGKRVDAAAVNFAETVRYFRNATVTGIPVREAFFGVAPKRSGPMRLLVFGGSQGARVLNEVMPRVAGALLKAVPELEIVHQVGGRHEATGAAAYQAEGLGGDARLRVVPYLDVMVGEFEAADLMLCRSGASTVAELAAAGKASVLVPFAAATDDHQRKNADAFVEAGAARMVPERELSAERLVEVVGGLLADRQELLAMGERARGLAHPDAVKRIAEMVVGLA